MNKNEWDKSLIEHFAPKKAGLNLDLLMEMVAEVMDGGLTLVSEEKEGVARTYTIKQIPMIPVSELGWANNADGDGGGSQRTLLEDWLKNIQGTGFQEKLDGVTERMRAGFGEIPKTADAKYIQEVMSYLVFVKTLTMAITNFNASAAGFNFEAFLATLMAGSQIPASGAKTIADFTADIDGSVVPISLKLYTEGQLEVGGSFTDLVNDLAVPNESWASWAASPEYDGGAMKYIVCTKDFEKSDDPLARSGKINFYEFDVSRKNVFRLLAESSKAGREMISSSESFMVALSEWDKTKQGTAPDLASTLPTKTAIGAANELATKLAEVLRQELIPQMAEAGLDQEKAASVVAELIELYADNIESSKNPRKLGSAAQVKMSIAKALYGQEANTRNKEQKAVFEPILTKVDELFRNFKEDYLKKMDKRGEAISEIKWVFGREPRLVEWYESLSPEAKAIALKNTRGFLTTGHWKIPNKAAITAGGGKPFAVMPIGAKYVQALLEQVRNEVMDEIFSIFDNMARMSEKLNSFFANGLKEKGEAKVGAEAGEEAAETTKKVADIK